MTAYWDRIREEDEAARIECSQYESNDESSIGTGGDEVKDFEEEKDGIAEEREEQRTYKGTWHSSREDPMIVLK